MVLMIFWCSFRVLFERIRRLAGLSHSPLCHIAHIAELYPVLLHLYRLFSCTESIDISSDFQSKQAKNNKKVNYLH